MKKHGMHIEHIQRLVFLLICISIKKDDDRKMYLGSTGETSNISYSLIGTPIYIKWNNIDVKIPENVHDVLVFRYGEDYMTPKNGFKGRNP